MAYFYCRLTDVNNMVVYHVIHSTREKVEQSLKNTLEQNHWLKSAVIETVYKYMPAKYNELASELN